MVRLSVQNGSGTYRYLRDVLSVLTLGLNCFEDHALPDIRDTARSREFYVSESNLSQRCRERVSRPEFNMAVIPQCGEVLIHLPEDR